MHSTHLPRSIVLATLSLALPLCLGCGDSGTGDPAGSDSSLTTDSGSTDSGAGGGGGLGDGPNGSSAAGASAPAALVFAHTDTRLYTLDPLSADLVLTEVGDFDCIGDGPGLDSAMTDFGVNATLDLWGISGHDVHPLDETGGAVHCAPEIKLENPDVRFYALTFAPAGVLDRQKEVLVAGNTAGELWSIDTAGTLTPRGIFGSVPPDDGNGHAYENAGKSWELSGDIVFLANGGEPVGFATVRDCPNPPETSGCNFVNTLIEIDVPMLATAGPTTVITKSVRGQIVKGPACSDATAGNYGNMYGIAVWSDRMFGFSRTGNLVQIDMNDGTGCLVRHYDGDLFAGAGVTTLAPVDVPPPK